MSVPPSRKSPVARPITPRKSTWKRLSAHASPDRPRVSAI